MTTKRLLVLLSALLASGIAHAQVTPPAPQSVQAMDGIDGGGIPIQSGFVRVGYGNSGYVDPNSSYCRYVTNGSPARTEETIDIATPTAWQDWRASPGAGDASVTCCRPQTVNLCGGAVQQTLPYTAYQGTQSYTQNCGTYTETQSWTCGSTLPASPNAVLADGAWQQSADTNVQNCSANWQSIYQGCTAGCGQYGYYQYYNYDANSCPGDNAYYSYAGSCYGGNCCQPVKVGCSGSTAIMSCGPNVPGGCVGVPCVVGGGSCSCNVLSPSCVANPTSAACKYYNCGPWTTWGNTSSCVGANDCISGPQGVDSGPTTATCYGTCYQ